MALGVSHNVSRGKQQEIELRRRIAALRPFLVPGWQIDSDRGRIVEVPTVLGCHQRGQQVLLKCSRPDCRRRIELDLKAAVHAGLADRPIMHLHQLLKCNHWSGCELAQASAIYPNGVPLVAYLQHEDVLISVSCTGCTSRLLLPPSEVIRRLQASGRGDGATGVLELGKAVRGPCRKCGQARFESQVLWTKSKP
jgi:hypothetical protein